MSAFSAGFLLQMRVNVDEIKEQGTDRSWELTREQVDAMVAGDGAGYRAASPTQVTARLKKVGRQILLDARTSVRLTCPCGRCLVPVSVTTPVSFELTLVPAEAERPARSERPERDDELGSFAPQEVDLEVYSGKEIDLDPIVREQLLLALPGYPVCNEDCKGLCSVCGTNLNERDCKCDRHVPDPRWAGLKDMLKQ
jgi:uncharacterized protein